MFIKSESSIFRLGINPAFVPCENGVLVWWFWGVIYFRLSERRVSLSVAIKSQTREKKSASCLVDTIGWVN